MNVRIIILAAGKGTRMNSDTPKVLTQFADMPIITRIANTASKIDPTPVVVLGHDADLVAKALPQNCITARQSAPLGTGDATRAGLEIISPKESDVVLVIPGDHPLIKVETLQAIVSSYVNSSTDVVITTLSVPHFGGMYESLTHYGRVLRNNSGDIIAVRENRDATGKERSIREVNLSFYGFKDGWLRDNLTALSNSNVAGEYYLTDTIEIASHNGDIIKSVSINDLGEAFGINTPKDLARLEVFYAVGR